MRCPECSKEIGAFVEMGSAAYQRVSHGCCPHCGVSLPPAYRIGLSSGTNSVNVRAGFEMSRTAFARRAAAVLIAVFVVLWSLWTDGRAQFGTGALIIFLSIADILFGSIVFLHYTAIGRPNSFVAFMLEGLISKKERPSAVLGGLKLLFDFLLVLVMLAAQTAKGNILWPAFRLGLAALLALWYAAAAMPAKRRSGRR